MRLLGGQVDTRLRDALDLAESLLDPPHARGAGHALDRQDHVAVGLGGTVAGGATRLRQIAHAVASLLDGGVHALGRGDGRVVDDVAFSVARLTLAS